MPVYLKRVSDLATYLSDSYRTADEIAKHIVLRTFSELSPTALYMAEITIDGFLAPVTGFGFEQKQLDGWGRFPLTLNIPITDSVRKDACILINSPEEFYERYPDLHSIPGLDRNWTSCIAWPMLPYGVGFAILQQKTPSDEEFEFFLRSVGAVVALNQLQGLHTLNHRASTNGKAAKAKSVELSQRQRLVCDLLLKGFTNLEISREIGYSESLVRHETIEIYRILSVSGRKQLIAENVAIS